MRRGRPRKYSNVIPMVIALIKEGKSHSYIAREFGFGRSQVSAIVRQAQRDIDLPPDCGTTTKRVKEEPFDRSKFVREVVLAYKSALSLHGPPCRCRHLESQHLSGVCTNVNAGGDCCECVEFISKETPKRKDGEGNQDIMGRGVVSLDVPIKNDKYREATSDIVDMSFSRASIWGTLGGELFEDDHWRFVQMGYIGRRRAA